MYSIVLLAALSAGESTPDFGWKHHASYAYGVCYGPCYGACYTTYGPWQGGWGTPYGGYGPAGYACYGACGCYSSPAYGFPSPVISVAPPAPAPVPGETLKKEDEQVSAPNRARLIVDLPAGAKLYVDDAPINNAGPRKSFRTPALQKGEDYFYEIRAEVMRDGKPVSETRRVVVTAGKVVRTDFRSLGEATGVASAKKR
jgi:uncharacterized protein (TIGR03000 family)